MKYRVLKVLLGGPMDIRFIVAAVLGFSFSLAIILVTVGVMDGFEYSLKKGLRRSEGDVVLFSQKGFFHVDSEFEKKLAGLDVKNYTSMVETKGFLIHGTRAKGVLIRGVEEGSFSTTTNLPLNPLKGGMAIGSVLAEELQVETGESVSVALSGGSRSGSVLLKRFPITQIITHGIYKKDLRMAYLELEQMQHILGVDGHNMVSLILPESMEMEQFRWELESLLGYPFSTLPFWHGFSSLIKAVKVEKFMITLILQLIVIISVVNVVALVIFLNERKSKEIFLFKALGMSQYKMAGIWQTAMGGIWFFSSLLSLLWVALFKYFFAIFSKTMMPQDIYSLGSLVILLDVFDYALVFLLGFLWLFGVSTVGLWTLKKKSILFGLRREFA